MTLNKHKLDGFDPFYRPTISATVFEQRMKNAGYQVSGSAPAQGRRVKVWWIHQDFRLVESIYSPDKNTVITAYHP